MTPNQVFQMLKKKKVLPRKIEVNPIDAFVTYSIPKPSIVPKGEEAEPLDDDSDEL